MCAFVPPLSPKFNVGGCFLLFLSFRSSTSPAPNIEFGGKGMHGRFIQKLQLSFQEGGCISKRVRAQKLSRQTDRKTDTPVMMLEGGRTVLTPKDLMQGV